jgi:biopolymer transport protein ExbD
MAFRDDALSVRRNPKRYRIALTPLADAMFQLLIYFMLSSNVTPYSLISLKGALTTPGGQGGNGTGAAQPAPGTDTTVWTVQEGSVIAGGQPFQMDKLAELTTALALSGTTSVTLIVRPEAKVQDLTSVLEALAAGGITDVQLAGRGA